MALPIRQRNDRSQDQPRWQSAAGVMQVFSNPPPLPQVPTFKKLPAGFGNAGKQREQSSRGTGLPRTVPGLSFLERSVERPALPDF